MLPPWLPSSDIPAATVTATQTWAENLFSLSPRSALLSAAAHQKELTGSRNADGSVQADYSFSAVAAGTYTLRVSKNNHVTREYTITVGAEAVVKDIEIWLCGDVTGDGLVDMTDAVQIDRKYNGKTSVFGSADAETEAYRLIVANVYAADGIIDTADSNQIDRFFNGKPSIIDSDS